MRSERQSDLFAGAGFRAEETPAAKPQNPPLVPGDLSDAALIASIPRAGLADHGALTEEAARRKLVAAVPALAALCRRFKGFGLADAVPEQTAALQALVAIDGRDAASAVVGIIVEQVVQGPGLAAAASAGASLGCSLPVGTVEELLRHADPAVRADACRCALARPEAAALLIGRLDDIDDAVARAAACALGRMGRREARPMLVWMLQAAPSAEAIEAVAGVADEECIVWLRRVALNAPHLASVATDALAQIEELRAAAATASSDCSAARPAEQKT